MRIRLRIEPVETYLYSGPEWEPVVYDGIYPLVHEPGDLYINRYRSPPLYYLFTGKNNCEMVSREEIKEWVTGGLMSSPMPVQSPIQFLTTHPLPFPVE